MCLARTDNLDDPASWRGWDGSDFTVRFINPYTEPDANPAEHVCSPVSPQQLNPRMTASLTFNTYLNRWLLVDDNEGGFFSSVSSDLVTWSPRQLFLSSGILNSYACGDPDPVKYPSLIDPASPDRNFATTGQTFFIYYTRLHAIDCRLTQDRDLVRVPVQVDLEPPADSPAAPADPQAPPPGQASPPAQPLPVPASAAPPQAPDAAMAVGWCAPVCAAANFAPSTTQGQLLGPRLHFNSQGKCPQFTLPAGIIAEYGDGTRSASTFGPASLPRVCMADFARR